MIVHVAEGAGGVGDSYAGDDGGGGNDDVFFHDVGFVFGSFPAYPVVAGHITTCLLADSAAGWPIQEKWQRRITRSHPSFVGFRNISPRNLKLFLGP